MDSSKPDFELEWSQVLPIGAGLVNQGNTCYANAVLQSLTYTPPLANYMLTGEHSQRCGENGFCMMCAMEKHISNVLRNTGSNIKPIAELRQLNWMGQQYEHGAQQDAHEFLNHILQAMHQSCLSGCRLNGQTMDDSLVHEIFGGHLRVMTTCSSCGGVSHTFEPYRDITVGIKGAYNVPQALRWHLKPKQLDVETGYKKCWKCKNIVQAFRKVSFYEVSKVLIITLKRFDHSNGKIVKRVRYPEYLDMRPFMSESSGEPEMYRLYGVVTHHGHHCDSGHYYCHVKASDGQWYKMNDTCVSKTNRRSALMQQAYLLFYVRSSKPDHLRNTPHQSSSNSLPGPVSTSMAFNNKMGASKDGNLNRERSAQRPPKLNRQAWDNFQTGVYQRPQRRSANCLKRPDMEKSVTDGHQSTPQHRKRRLVDGGDECQEQSAKRRTLKGTNRIYVSNCSSELRNEEQRNQKRRSGTDVQRSSDRPKRARANGPELSFKGGYRKNCNRAVIDDLSACFTHLRIV